MIENENIDCEKCAWFGTVLGQRFCHRRSHTLPFQSMTCVHFESIEQQALKGEEAPREEKPQEADNSNKVCSIRLKCFTFGKNGGICAEDFISTSFIIINPNAVLYKTAIKEFELPLSGKRTGKRYFCIVMLGDYCIYCPESEFEKI